MSEEEVQKLKNEFPNFFASAPPKLIEFIFSEKTSSQIASICLKNGVEDGEKIGDISYRITLVLLGDLPKESLIIALKNGVGLDAQTAEKISAETDKLIFSQMPMPQAQPQSPPIKTEEPVQPEPPRPPKKPDIYHESIE